MNKLLSVVFLLIILSPNSFCQDRMPGGASDPGAKNEAAPRDYSSVIEELFAPIKEKLNLTKEQEFQIIAIITEAEVRSTPLAQSLAIADQQLAELSFTGPLDEAKVHEISDQEALFLSEMILMKVHAKANIYKLLTPDQRALVAQQFRAKPQLEGHLGSISIY
jgi:hypothetical protein